jgi:PAS domain-containing protein
MVISIISTIASEIAFTFYIGVFDFSNVLGHIFKIIASFFAYKAIIETGLENPYKLLFRKLKASEIALKQKADDLEQAFSETDQIFNASLPLRLIDTNCEIVKLNDTFCKIFQVNRENIIGKKCYEIFPHKFCHTPDCAMKKINNGEKQVEYEIEYERKNRTKISLMI